MTISKKRKRILCIAIPAAVIVIAAGVVLWLVLGQGKSYQPFEIWRNPDSNAIVYCAVKGEVDSQTASEQPPPFYTFTPSSDWTMTQSATEPSEYGYYDNTDCYQSPDGATTLSFTQSFATSQILAANTDSQPQFPSYNSYLDPAYLSEVWFGNTQVIYYQEPYTDIVFENEERMEVDSTNTGVYWVHDQSLLHLSCDQAVELNQMLEWMTQVDYTNLRQRVEPEEEPIRPLELERGSVQVTEMEDGRTMSSVEYYRSEGNPEIPDNPVMPTFPQAPEGWTLVGKEDDLPILHLEKYVDDQGEILALDCTTGAGELFQNDAGTTKLYLPFSGMGWAELEDQSSVQDATVNGNPAFVHINQDVSEIAWIDGYCTLQLRCTKPLSEEELIALAEQVS